MKSKNDSSGMPLVSIFLPTYNHEKFIRQAIESALDQTYQNIEIVVGDDCSTDSTWDIISELYSKYPTKIIAFRNQRNLGITGNCNEVLKRCKGKYIAFTSGDDLFLPDKIAKQVAVMEANESIVLCYHDVEVFDSISNTPIRYYYSGKNSFAPVYGNARKVLQWIVAKLNPLSGVSVMVRRDTIPATGYDPRLPFVSDGMMWIDILAKAEETAQVVFLPQVLARYRRHDCNVTDNIELVRDDPYIALALAEAKYPWLAPAVSRGMSTIRYGRGLREVIGGNPALGRQLLFESLRSAWHPLTAAKVLYWLLVSFVPLLGSIRTWLQNRGRHRA